MWCNTLLSIHFTLFSFRDCVTLVLISRSPRHIAGFSDTLCRGYIYPYYRHNPQHSEPAEWQREIAKSVIVDHGYHLGLAPDARLNSKTFVVRNHITRPFLSVSLFFKKKKKLTKDARIIFITSDRLNQLFRLDILLCSVKSVARTASV